jgi:ADP-ribose pyrophosphatase YjhB (NUDIX family)
MHRELKRIPVRLYRRILASVPIPCVDVVIVSQGRFLLCKRNQHPAKGKWWLVGGRIVKGETFVQAVKRKVYEETGISTFAAAPQFLALRETMFRRSELGPPPHTINAVFLVVVSDKSPIRPDITSDKLAWFSKVNSHWSPYVKELLAEAGFHGVPIVGVARTG